MSIFSRIANVFRSTRTNREIAEELESHIAEGVAAGRSADEVRRSLGPAHHQQNYQQQSRATRTLPWLDSLRADIIFGWRQLMKRKVVSIAAVLSLALAMGACVSAFRLVDALLFRPLPIQSPQRLYALFRYRPGTDSASKRSESTYEYPLYQQMRSAVTNADIIGLSGVRLTDLSFGSSTDFEKAQIQYISGNMFSAFGLTPAAGRLIAPEDDLAPQKAPFAVISYDYWSHRFGKDPTIIGRTFHLGGGTINSVDAIITIVGVAPKNFTGTEPGVVTDIFLPTMMYPGATHADWSWVSVLAMLHPGASPTAVASQLDAIFLTNQAAIAGRMSNRPRSFIERFYSYKTSLEPAPTGFSTLQNDYRLPLAILSILVFFVLIIACLNVANLMTVQAAARSQEMALRVSIGAGRRRLVQLVLTQSAILGLLSSALGLLFAWFAAPLVVNMISTNSTNVRLALSTDWRITLFAIALTFLVVLLFGLAPSLRASHIHPVSALKGGHNQLQRRRSLHWLVAAQIAFCIFVLFISSLFIRTFRSLANQPLGFNPNRVLLMEAVSQHPLPITQWDQLGDSLRNVPGVQNVSQSLFPLLFGDMMSSFVRVNGVASPQISDTLEVSPGWFATMRIPILNGRDFNPSDTNPNTAIVNRTFARDYFNTEDVVGKVFDSGPSQAAPYHVIAVVGDERYQHLRDPEPPVYFVPRHAAPAADGKLQTNNFTYFTLRTNVDHPESLAPALRQAVLQSQPEIRIRNITTSQQLVDAQTVRERLLATLAVFFAAIALLLAVVGLYGVLHYSVLQREREIGIRLALGAEVSTIAGLVTRQTLVMVFIGLACGLSLGLVSTRYIQSLLFGVKSNDASGLILPAAILIAASLLASLPAVFRAMRIDPAIMLRAE